MWAKPVKKGTFNRLETTILLESGSDYFVLSEKFRCLKTQFFVKVKVYNGKLVATLGKCSLKVHINDLATTFEFFGIPYYSHDMILGWNFSKQQKHY
ncbi:hypothetical protein LAZ67_3005875 [Cordylochernes scorpioides]|uniref:Uncharacterized protein n=1 Tax=Cordylochernes scorpioides TaxID=51811 RepID=A0ABY6KDT3_9ARAC|nr:hypothetical protein LAZ67_3005875 [Cordylochernes scorpioides]